MYIIGICDDGKNTCTFFEENVLQYAKRNNLSMDIKIWYTGEGVCKYLEQGGHLDILFLDIELIKVTGIEVGLFVRNTMEDRGMQIIYISGKSSYAQSLFKTQPLDFLIKPITKSQIDVVLDLAMKIISRGNNKFMYQYGKDYFYIPYNQIMYFTSDGRRIKIIMAGEERYFCAKLKDVLEKLPADFIWIHHSYVVNKKYIAQYKYDMVKLMDGTEITISKGKRRLVRESILQDE